MVEPGSILSVTAWLATKASEQLLRENLKSLFQNLGIIVSETKKQHEELHTLLDQHLRKIQEEIKSIRDVLTQDLISEFFGSFKHLRNAALEKDKAPYLAHAFNGFYRVTGIKETGITGDFSNQELRSLTFLGIAAGHSLQHQRATDIWESILSAIEADIGITERFLGTDNIREIAHRLGKPVTGSRVRISTNADSRQITLRPEYSSRRPEGKRSNNPIYSYEFPQCSYEEAVGTVQSIYRQRACVLFQETKSAFESYGDYGSRQNIYTLHATKVYEVDLKWLELIESQ
jgi:hypothetical protein